MRPPWEGEADLAARREEMVRRHLAGRGIRDTRVLGAFRSVPRERFIWQVDLAEAYADRPLRIGEGQTISQPYIVALMTAELGLAGPERVLEIGTGSGYQTAILAGLAREVLTVERLGSLSARARETLEGLGYSNVRFRVGDGTLGWPEEAPFERIIVTAAPPEVPAPLVEQLAVGGRMVIPVGGEGYQDLLAVTRGAEGVSREVITGCSFVKLVGEAGWRQGEGGR